MPQPIQTVHEVLEFLKQANPGKRWAISKSEQEIGCWADSLNRFYCVCASTITGAWVINPGECLINGQAHDYGWTPVEESCAA